MLGPRSLRERRRRDEIGFELLLLLSLLLRERLLTQSLQNWRRTALNGRMRTFKGDWTGSGGPVNDNLSGGIDCCANEREDDCLLTFNFGRAEKTIEAFQIAYYQLVVYLKEIIQVF